VRGGPVLAPKPSRGLQLGGLAVFYRGSYARIHEYKRSGRCFEVLSSKGLTQRQPRGEFAAIIAHIGGLVIAHFVSRLVRLLTNQLHTIFAESPVSQP
jgi:hypothetical protein